VPGRGLARPPARRGTTSAVTGRRLARLPQAGRPARRSQPCPHADPALAGATTQSQPVTAAGPATNQAPRAHGPDGRERRHLERQQLRYPRARRHAERLGAGRQLPGC